MQGQPRETIKYGKRVCHKVLMTRDGSQAAQKVKQLNASGIVTRLRKWYSWWVVYRCGAYKRGT